MTKQKGNYGIVTTKDYLKRLLEYLHATVDLALVLGAGW